MRAVGFRTNNESRSEINVEEPVEDLESGHTEKKTGTVQWKQEPINFEIKLQWRRILPALRNN